MVKRRGADADGANVFFFAISAGFSLAPFGAATTANAQTIAGLPIYSGWELRCVGALVMFAINAFFVVRYIKKVQADPSASLCAHDPNVVKFTGVFMIGFAGSIALVMTQGNIIHTCIHAMAGALSSLPPALTAIGMNIMNIFVNFFIISGPGQAFVVMPIQSPLASIVGVTQQTAILAYQLGDGFTNFIYPQSGVLMAGLAVSRVNWGVLSRVGGAAGRH